MSELTPAFEVLLVSIDWERPDKVRAITPSEKPLKLSSKYDNKYEYDIVTYTKENNSYFQLAIKTKFRPFLKPPQGKWNQATVLCNIKDDIWIIKDEWRTGQSGKGYHYCPSINTLGKIEIGLRDDLTKTHFITIDINSNIEDFDFNQLKDDFEGELWSLITSNKSSVSAEKIEVTHYNKIFRYVKNNLIDEFLKAFDQISKNPKRELSTTREIRRIEKVIPIIETYRKLSTVGTATLLPSKAVLENYDIYENRFICFMLHHIHLIISNNLKFMFLQKKKLEKDIENVQKKIGRLQDPDPKVNEDVFNQEISFQEQKVNELQSKWKAISDELTLNTEATFTQIKVKLLSKYPIDIKNNSCWCYLNGIFCSLKFPSNLNLMEYFDIETEFNFEAVYSEAETRTTNNHPKFEITDVRKIESTEGQKEQNILNKKKENLITLKDNNWRQLSILTKQERKKFEDERINQIQTLKNKISTLTEQNEKIKEFNLEREKLSLLIEQKLRTDFFKKNKMETFTRFQAFNDIYSKYSLQKCTSRL